jgi:hypothetical protein
MHPNEFRHEYVVLADTRFTVPDLLLKGTHSSEGMLEKGRVIWLRDKLRPDFPEHEVSAYADGAGVVIVDAQHLKPCSHVK